ncbi:helix-turn-helix domain-containing protein [Sulfurimonas sp.]|uniref:helix-turn-helix domain-containing protein n=1 Tax=Sulfurimonas sp. TaxID=2022749 RepID=UPI001A03DDAA|nr:helix-turn-helix domain-containing protein [Sulfurimonas sp.]MBE0515464.1 hypothetical protein [Sulfurimonas sp.]
MEKEFISERQAALLLGVAPRTVKLWRDKGLLDGFKFEERNEKRKNVFYIKEDLLKWFEIYLAEKEAIPTVGKKLKNW